MSVRGVRRVVDRILEWSLIACMTLMVANVLWQVATRFLLRNPSSFTEEIARYLLVWVGVLGGAYAVGMRVHLAIDLLPAKLAGRRAGAALELLVNLCILLFALLVLVIGGLALVNTMLKHGETSAALGLKVGYVYACLPVAGVIMILYAILNTAERIRRSRHGGASPHRSDR